MVEKRKPAGSEFVTKNKPLKVCIVGCCSDSQHLHANYPEGEWELWGLSMVYENLQRSWDRWFELHDIDYHAENSPAHYKWLCEQEPGKPIYLCENRTDVRAAKTFPKAAIIKGFGRYFTNSVSWMTALAIHEGATEIAIVGVNMAQNTEYAHQRPSCEYFLGVAVGRGIKIHIPDESDLLKTPRLYGFETHSGEYYVKWRTREKELRQRKAIADQQAEELNNKTIHAAGQLDFITALKQRNGDMTEWLQQQEAALPQVVQSLTVQRNTLQKNADMLEGAIDGHQWSRQLCELGDGHDG